ncbi:TetR/AcrR family transcriptional regulator [Actinopolymorpha pittospori]
MKDGTTKTPTGSTRERLLRAGLDLLARGGREALSTRAVSAAAGVQAPTIYRLFGDKDGLLDAVASYGYRDYLDRKQALGETDDPVEDLRRAWDLNIEFGLSMPALYVMMFGEARKVEGSAARQEALVSLRGRIARVASAGRLRMSVDRATQLFHATASGLVLSQIAVPRTERDTALSAVCREHMLRAITTDEEDASAAPESSIANRAVALHEALREGGTPVLTAAETALLSEWLDRLADATDGGGDPSTAG